MSAFENHVYLNLIGQQSRQPVAAIPHISTTNFATLFPLENIVRKGSNI